MFTTRPEILGTFGVVTSTHWLATASGMAMLEKGGNAFDACAAAAFVLQVVEPHLVGPGGDMPAVFYSAESKKVEVLCAQGTAPQAATIQAYKALGLDMIPGDGLLATVVPGAFGGWMALLRDHGRLSLREVLEPAIGYFENGHPMLPRVSDTIAGLTELFSGGWPSSGAVYLPGGNVPKGRELFRNPAAARTYKRILTEAEAAGSDRQEQIQAAHDAWYKGFVAEAMDAFCRGEAVLDSSGRRHKGLLTADDMARWQPRYEAPASATYHGWEVFKTGPWGQGPVFLQTLKILEGIDLAGMGPASPEYVHHVTEAMKLAFADREAYYGDPDFVKVPLTTLLSEDYASGRRALIGEQASHELRPGMVAGYEGQVEAMLGNLRIAGQNGKPASATVGEPTLASMVAASRRGDTVHIDVIDRWGNMIAATPSGGWLQSSPVIPELGFPLNSRAQSFYLEEGLPSSLAPGKRPRTTLTPSLAFENGEPRLVFGTPGGDQQEQWQLGMFLRRVHHDLNLQEAIDLPLFHTQHFPSSFYPREARPGQITVEESLGEAALAELVRRGHAVERAPAWTVGRLTAAERSANGLLRAAATPRLMQAYAAGR
ncbi:MAG: gamma-glutamyltransferase family protein [Bosea sp.]|uniref:gamma-glutamyltransferase family protein n=1 Tax=Bosea sp. (in: a-proteobacteria) TaxID=1871050 RepID=UPI00086F307A|nr:gamma-glutamyltransferase family protein [Bosea sp. (in: a-proteobacteria)]MBN9471917.1 gamma-glutamyltransferase family protein [Bosea sp. (in: a-proteobacteria)]ODT43454.1 MAG: gamma-glutamyltransferase [Methylobacterium sp. SCN 67-24]